MLTQYLVSIGATNLRKSKRRNDEAATSPQADKESAFHVHLFVESFCIVFQKYILLHGFKLSLVLNGFLIFLQLSGSCSYKFGLIKKKNVFCLSFAIE